MKRKFFPFLIVALSAVIAMALFACTKVTEPPSEAAPTAATTERKTNVLFLGDSIGEGLAGPAPLTERENYAYYGIIGNVNGYSYYNRAVTGYTTGDLLELVLREDDGINMVESLITTADLIHISIVGNDFLISNHAQMMVDLAYDNYSRITPRKTRAKANLDAILTRIRTLNPNAVIILQTLYNPADESTPLIPSSAKTYLTNKGIEPEGYHALVQKIVDEINSTLTEYLEEHTVTDQSGNALPPFELLDVYGAFEKIYEEDRERWTTLFYQDGYHPSAAGHAVIAEVLQQKLTELRLAAPNALPRTSHIQFIQTQAEVTFGHSAATSTLCIAPWLPPSTARSRPFHFSSVCAYCATRTPRSTIPRK